MLFSKNSRASESNQLTEQELSGACRPRVFSRMKKAVSAGAGTLAVAIAAGSLLTPLDGTAAERIRYIHTDALGSPVATTDENGLVLDRTSYEPFGAVVDSPTREGPGFTGHVVDRSTGLTYMQQRYMDPQLGRFLSVDPIAAKNAPASMFNRYHYANGNPYRFYDPDGRCTGSRIANEDGTCKISGGLTTMGTTASTGQSGAAPVSVPESIKVESQGHNTLADAATAAGSQYGEMGVDKSSEVQLGFVRVTGGGWGYLTPGWGPEGVKIVNPQPLLDAYRSAGYKVAAWMHGHFDHNLNFSANDFGLVWGKGVPTFLETGMER